MTAIRYPVTIDGETVEVGTANELAVVLDVLQGQHDRVVLEQLGTHLAEIITTPLGLYNVLRALAPADQLYLITTLGPRLADTIGSAAHLRDLLATLSAMEVEEALLRTLGSEGIGQLIATAQELAEVLEWVYGDCDQLALSLLGVDRLRRMLATGYDLSLVLHSLEAQHQTELIEQLGWDWVAARPANARDLAYLLRALPSAAGNALLSRYTRGELVQLIGNEREWTFLWRRLEADEAAHLFKLLGVECDA